MNGGNSRGQLTAPVTVQGTNPNGNVLVVEGADGQVQPVFSVDGSLIVGAAGSFVQLVAASLGLLAGTGNIDLIAGGMQLTSSGGVQLSGTDVDVGYADSMTVHSGAGTFTVHQSGGPGVGVQLLCDAASIEIKDGGGGFVLHDHNGTRWRVTVSDTGALQVNAA